jgi:hypothetical protein
MNDYSHCSTLPLVNHWRPWRILALWGGWKVKDLNWNESARADVKQLVLELPGRHGDGFCPLEVIDHG